MGKQKRRELWQVRGGQKVTLPYGNGCLKYPDCFTCPEKDCKGTSRTGEHYSFGLQHAREQNKGAGNNG